MFHLAKAAFHKYALLFLTFKSMIWEVFIILHEVYNILVFLTDYLKGQLWDIAASSLDLLFILLKH